MSPELSVHQEHEVLQKLQLAGLNSAIAQAIVISKDNDLAKQIIAFAAEKIGINLMPQTIYLDYKPIKKGIVIKAMERNRQKILSDSAQYVLGGDNFKNKILVKCKNGKTATEILREDELLKRKTDKEIKKEMQISGEISADQIAERIIQLGKIDQWVIIGYCNGLVVYAFPFDVGRVGVGAFGLGGWDVGYRLLSSDIEALKV